MTIAYSSSMYLKNAGSGSALIRKSAGTRFGAYFTIPYKKDPILIESFFCSVKFIACVQSNVHPLRNVLLNDFHDLMVFDG